VHFWKSTYQSVCPIHPATKAHHTTTYQLPTYYSLASFPGLWPGNVGGWNEARRYLAYGSRCRDWV